MAVPCESLRAEALDRGDRLAGVRLWDLLGRRCAGHVSEVAEGGEVERLVRHRQQAAVLAGVEVPDLVRLDRLLDHLQLALAVIEQHVRGVGRLGQLLRSGPGGGESRHDQRMVELAAVVAEVVLGLALLVHQVLDRLDDGAAALDVDGPGQEVRLEAEHLLALRRDLDLDAGAGERRDGTEEARTPNELAQRRDPVAALGEDERVRPDLVVRRLAVLHEVELLLRVEEAQVKLPPGRILLRRVDVDLAADE